MSPSLPTRLLIVLTCLLSFLPASLVSAQDAPGVVDDREYESPQFGYTVTWSRDWDVRESGTTSDEGEQDVFSLLDGSSRLTIIGQPADLSPQRAVEKWIRDEGRSDEVVDDTLDADVPSATIEHANTTYYVEGHALESADAVVLIVLQARTSSFDDMQARVADEVELNDVPLLTGDPLEAVAVEPTEEPTEVVEPTEEPTEVVEPTEEPTEIVEPTEEPTEEATQASSGDSGSYTGTVYPYTVTWDTGIWEQYDTISDIDTDGVELRADNGALTIWTTSLYGTDPVECVDGEATYFRRHDPTVSDWTEAEDANGDPIAYESDEFAYGVYTLTYTDPENDESYDLVDYIECRQMPDADAVMVIFVSATPEQYNDFLPLALDVADTVTFGDAAATPSADGTAPEDAVIGESTPEADTTFELSTPSAELDDPNQAPTAITGESYGYIVEVPAGFTVQDQQMGGAEEVSVMTSDVSEITIRATDAADGDMAACLDLAVKSVSDRDPEETNTHVTDTGAAGIYTLDGGEFTLIATCQPLKTDGAVLIVSNIVATADVEQGQEDMHTVLDGVWLQE